ncbi:MAG TPA: branched-chain amino acid ABC transporter substrate-binding protein, partial [Elusimicrobiota bacterium]|nr:branched-chain amino acid ABC transporter substrate-binding protein [Elusimicrobiota bacterium]
MLAAVILALSASAPARAAETVRIAVAAPLTGDLAPDGQSIRRAVDLAVAEANASKAFPFAIEALALDDRADPKEAVNVANLISADGRVVAVVGHVNSGCCLPASRVYAKAGIPMLTPTGISGEITSQQLAPGWSWPRLVLRLPPRDDVQGAASARFCLERLKARRVAIIQDQTPYGQGLARAFRAALEAGGGSVASEDAVSVGDRDFKALAARLAEEKPQAVYF